MRGDNDFNIWDDIFGAPDIDRDGDVDMMDAMLRDDMDEYTKSAVYGDGEEEFEDIDGGDDDTDDW